MRIARVLLSKELLRDALHLPFGTEIVGAGMEQRDIVLTITHADLREVALAEGTVPPLISPTMHQEDGVVLLVDWGQP